MTRTLPKRIEPDAIVEAIVEVRFQTDLFPEVILGRLLSSPFLSTWSATRLPGSDIPYAARDAEAAFRYQPMFQLERGTELIRLGAYHLSLHILPPYCGWEQLRAKAREFLEQCWTEVGRSDLKRCGLRYVNALTAGRHGVRSIEDLNLHVDVRGKSLVDVTVAYGSEENPHAEALVRIASKKHVVGELAPDATFVVDIDIHNEQPTDLHSANDIMSWLEQAHELEKRLFFDLLPDRIVDPLKEGAA